MKSRYRCGYKKSEDGSGWLIYLEATGQPVDGYYFGSEREARATARRWSSKAYRESLIERLAHCRFIQLSNGFLALHW